MKKEDVMATIGRRQFNAALIGGSAVLWLGGCGGDPDTELEQLDGNVRISRNHGHLLVIPAADLNSPFLKTYEIRGAVDDHTHVVFINADQLRRIKEGQVVAIGSGAAVDPDELARVGLDNVINDPLPSVDGHTHTITANPVL